MLSELCIALFTKQYNLQHKHNTDTDTDRIQHKSTYKSIPALEVGLVVREYTHVIKGAGVGGRVFIKISSKSVECTYKRV